MNINSLKAQRKFSDDLKVMVNYHAGYNIPEYQFLSYITEDYIRSIDVALVKETTGKNSWEQLYDYPEYGLSFFYSTLGNDEILGRELAITYFFKVNIATAKKIRIYNRTGIGLSYVNRKFDLEENNLNVAVGSFFNIHFNSRFGVNYTISDKVEVNSGLSFDHFSNANTSEPNLGINYLTGYTGFSYRLGEKNEKKKQVLETHEKLRYTTLFTSIGGKHARSLSSKYFFTSSVSLDVEKSYTRVFHMGTGFDLFYDSSVETQLLDAEKSYKKMDDFQSGIHISQSIIYNRISLTIQEGIYLFLVEKVDDYVMYNRGIVKYQFTDDLSVRFTMKSHLHILDYPELGFGLKL